MLLQVVACYRMLLSDALCCSMMLCAETVSLNVIAYVCYLFSFSSSIVAVVVVVSAVMYISTLSIREKEYLLEGFHRND